jgi:hypothetical protein
MLNWTETFQTGRDAMTTPSRAIDRPGFTIRGRLWNRPDLAEAFVARQDVLGERGKLCLVQVRTFHGMLAPLP